MKVRLLPHEAQEPAEAPDRVRELRRVMEILTLRMRVDEIDLPSRLGLQNRELSVLSRVALVGPTTLKELVADLEIPPSTMTALVDRLEATGFVRRIQSDEDRRVVRLEATPAAVSALDESMGGFSRVATRMLDVLSEDEQRQLVELLQRIAERF